MKPTLEQIASAVMELGSIPFFPSDPGAQLAITRQIEKFTEDLPKLRWLVDAAVNTMRRWEGIPELRGLYCTRYKPMDGVEAHCSLPGYSPADSEMKCALGALEPQQLESGKGMRLLAAPDDAKALEKVFGIPAKVIVKAMPQIPEPTEEDRAYSEKLLGHLV